MIDDELMGSATSVLVFKEAEGAVWVRDEWDRGQMRNLGAATKWGYLQEIVEEFLSGNLAKDSRNTG